MVSGNDPNATPTSGHDPAQWFDISAVTIPAALTGGNLGLQSQTGPPVRTLDLSLFKDFKITERFKVQFRAESFNLANTPVYNTPGNNLQDSKLLGRKWKLRQDYRHCGRQRAGTCSSSCGSTSDKV